MSEKEEHQREAKENILSQLVRVGGFWTSPELMREKLEGLPSEKSRVQAIKVQLKVRKEIIGQKADRNLFTFSSGGVTRSAFELEANLTQLMAPSHDIAGDRLQLQKILEDPACLQYKYISHCWEGEDGICKWWEGYIHHLVSTGTVTEYKIEYISTDKECYMEFDEIVTDIRNGDLIILWDRS